MTENTEIIEQPKKKKKKIWLIILLSVLGVLLVAGLVIGLHIHRIMNDPASFFDDPETVPVTEYTPNTVVEPVFPIDPVFTEVPDTDPTGTDPDDTGAVTDPAIGTDTDEEPADPPYNVLNVMLMGIDAFEDGSTSSGSMPHTDVSIVLAINFEKNTVDMISLQRDTFTTIPGYRGYYKLNGVFNVGGGMDNKKGGFELVCRTAEQWLGGISIPYYYAVDFEAVVSIVDAMGGIDYDVDQPFTSHDGKKHYDRGKQHLDGNAVLGYLRIRRDADGLDKSRNTRQRKMLLAIFNKLKNEGKISQIPALLAAAKDGLYTNTTASQTAALINFAKGLDSKNINSRAMQGTIKLEYDWAWAFVDQQHRVDLVKEVYNINVKPVGICTMYYEQWLHDTGFDALKHIRQAEKVLTYVAEQKAGGKTYTDDQIKLYSDCYNAYVRLNDLFNDATDKLGKTYTGQLAPEGGTTVLEQTYADAITEAEAAVKNATEALRKSVGYKGKIIYTVYKGGWYNDKDINEVYVDFR